MSRYQARIAVAAALLGWLLAAAAPLAVVAADGPVPALLEARAVELLKTAQQSGTPADYRAAIAELEGLLGRYEAFTRQHPGSLTAETENVNAMLFWARKMMPLELAAPPAASTSPLPSPAVVGFAKAGPPAPPASAPPAPPAPPKKKKRRPGPAGPRSLPSSSPPPLSSLPAAPPPSSRPAPPPTPAGPISETQARKALAKAGKYAQAHPGEDLLVAIRYFEVALRYAGTAAAGEALRQSAEANGRFLAAQRAAAAAGGSGGAGLSAAEEALAKLRWYVKAAVEGDAQAQCSLGVCYDKGEIVTRDPAAAARWYRQSAAQGYAPAQYNLGVRYDTGEGAARDLPRAIACFRQAADQGFAPAQYNLGICYNKGDGVEQDPVQATRLFRAAAEQGYALAEFNLGAAYYNGIGVKRDPAAAIQWFRRAAAQGMPEAQAALEKLGAK